MTSYTRLAELEREGKRAAVATVIRTQGSVPRHEGSRMVIFPDGSIEGTIGGGEMEHRVIEAAQQAIKSGKLTRLNYSFRDPARGDRQNERECQRSPRGPGRREASSS